MKIEQIVATDIQALAAQLAALSWPDAQLALVFGAPALIGDPLLLPLLRQSAPQAILAGCSTAGEISPAGISDNSLVVTLIEFARVGLSVATTDLVDMADSLAAGERLGNQLRAPDLKAILVLGQGIAINGSALIDGMALAVGEGVPITGGLAGDGTRFQETWVLTDRGASHRALVALGLHGDALRFNHGSFGGWEAFGTLRKVSRSDGNVLFELDGRPALDIYKEYLGDYVRDLPSSGLLFPFEMIGQDLNSTGVIRTILGINEADRSLTLAGDIDADGYLRLMHASTDRLVCGAEAAASAARDMAQHPDAGLGLLISCVGRKLVMGERVDEEIEAVAAVLGTHTALAGFYSYGELSPFAPGASCRLHNQTMTVTWIAEAP